MSMRDILEIIIVHLVTSISICVHFTLNVYTEHKTALQDTKALQVQRSPAPSLE